MDKKTLSDALDVIRESEDYLAEFTIVQFTEELCRLLDINGVSQRELAEKVGRSDAYISRVLNGNANFTVKTMSVLADALGSNMHVHLAPKNAWVNWNDIPVESESLTDSKKATVHISNVVTMRKKKNGEGTVTVAETALFMEA